MLFLYRPRQTWMPFAVRPPTQQRAYNRSLQEKFEGSRRVPPPVPATQLPAPTVDAAAGLSPPAQRDPIAALKELAALHESGALDDAEFAAAKAKLLT
jgi:hypothetical protein